MPVAMRVSRSSGLAVLLRLLPLVCVIQLTAAVPASALEVLVIRHADKDVQRGDYNLSPAGFRRAITIARLIPACFGRITGITTYLLDPRTSKNARSYQTAVPLAVATGVPIQIDLEAEAGSEQSGERIRRQLGASDARLLLFWEHRRIPELVRGLGLASLAPIADDDFDGLYVLRYPVAGAPPQLPIHRQSELVKQPCFVNASLPWDQPSASPSSRR
jgi:hypothetical protein